MEDYVVEFVFPGGVPRPKSDPVLPTRSHRYYREGQEKPERYYPTSCGSEITGLATAGAHESWVVRCSEGSDEKLDSSCM
jgi:hypothetical protein